MPDMIALPRFLIIGGGASLRLADILTQLGLSRPLVVTDRFMVQLGRAELLTEGLRAASICSRLFADTVPDPTIASVRRGIRFLQMGKHDCVIALGGGSVIDTAKAIAVMGSDGGDVASYKAPHVQDAPGLPVVAIPTTAGTGSEATRFVVVTNETTDEKMLCCGNAYLPVAALVDYELTLTKPKRLTADTALDSLTHAIEAYVSRRSNPFSDVMALAAMRAIAPYVRRAYHDGSDVEAREALMRGATLAGIAFSNSSVGLVHGMSRPIGAHFHVSHGLSNAMLLPKITAFSVQADLQRYAAGARVMGLASESEGDQSAIARLLNELSAINVELEVPTPKAYGIDEEKWNGLLANMADQALASGSPANNPRVPSNSEIIELYKQVWE